MNDEQITKKISAFGEIDVKAPKHRTALRAALMREHARVRRPSFSLTTLTQYITMKTALIPISTFAVVALVMIGTIGVTNNTAQAQELVQRSMARAVQLPAEMRAKLEAQMKADMMETLREAYAATDLRILTREEYEKEAQFTFATGTPHLAIGSVHGFSAVDGPPLGSPETISFRATRAMPIHLETKDVVYAEPAIEETADAGTFTVASAVSGDVDNLVFTKAATVSATDDVAFTAGTLVGTSAGDFSPPVKYLRYSAPDGRKVTLGLDESDTPVFRIEELTADDVIQGPNGEIGIQGKVLKMINIHTENFDGGYGSAGAIKIQDASVESHEVGDVSSFEVINQ